MRADERVALGALVAVEGGECRSVLGPSTTARPFGKLATGAAAKVLLREIQITEPKIIVCMGTATAAVLMPRPSHSTSPTRPRSTATCT